MRKTQMMAGIALLAFGCLGTTAGAQQINGTVHVVTGKARFAHNARSGTSRHSLKLKLIVGPKSLSDFHDPEQHTLRAVLGETVLFEAAPGADGFRIAKNGNWRYRGRHGAARVKISANGLSGKVKIALSRASLPELYSSNARDLPLTFEMASAELTTTASFAVKNARVRKWKGLANDFVPGGGTGPGPGPGPGGDPQQVGFSVFRQGMLRLIAVRPHEAVRTQGEWTSFWLRQQPGASPPAVDFTEKMAMGVFLAPPPMPSGGSGNLSAIRIVSISDSTSRREVVWEEVPNSIPWTCPPASPFAPCVAPASFQIVLAPQSSLPVVFREK
jgi:hypothetical protein